MKRTRNDEWYTFKQIYVDPDEWKDKQTFNATYSKDGVRVFGERLLIFEINSPTITHLPAVLPDVKLHPHIHAHLLPNTNNWTSWLKKKNMIVWNPEHQ